MIAPSVAASVELGLVDIGDVDPGAAGGEQRQRGDEADRPGADHQPDVARLDRRLGRAMHADGQRLDHRGLGEGDVVRQLEGEQLGMDHRRPQDAVHRRRRPEAHRRIDVVDAEPRRPAVGVGDARLHADPVADLQRP